MKITNAGKGVHQREISGIEKLRELPDHWHAFTNLDLALPGKGTREIDLVLVIEDRLLLVDLKDWVGPITSQDGNWLNGKRICGRSPVGKIAENVRELAPLLKKFVTEQDRKEQSPGRRLWTPWVEGVVVLTRAMDRKGIAPSEAARVFSIGPFMKMLRNREEREAQLGVSQSRSTDYTSPEWIARFRNFFNVSNGIFRSGSKSYGGYRAGPTGEASIFRHKDGIFAEFEVEEEGIQTSAGLLRRWDFSAAEARFQTEEGRATIAGRERSVISWLDDRNPKCGDAVLKPKVWDPEGGVGYWEVFERRRRMRRLSDFATSELGKTLPKERLELVRQLISQFTAIHELQAAHLDIGPHSIWLELPATVRLSHLMAASVPTVETLGERRFQFLSSSVVPEDVLGGPADPLRKDIFLLGCMAHLLVFGVAPPGNPPEWNTAVDPNGEVSALHPWFERALDVDQLKRFPNAREMLNAFNESLVLTGNGKRTREGLDKYKSLKSQRQIFQAYPESELIREDDRVAIWRSGSGDKSLLIKMWKGLAIGEVEKEAPRILAFLDKARAISEAPIPGIAEIVDVHWTEDSMAIASKYDSGLTLAEMTAKESARIPTADALRLLLRLTEIVTGLHSRLFAHGDLKPDNILLALNESGGRDPLLIDVMDYSRSEDGERLSRAYAPTSGGAFERDRYAVTKICEEVIQSLSTDVSLVGDIFTAAAACRDSVPSNGTLLPLQEALERLLTPPSNEGATVIRRISIAGSLGPMHSDEGLYWVSRTGRRFFIRGATDQIALDLDEAGNPIKATRSALSQSDIHRGRRHEYGSFGGVIYVDGPGYGLTSLSEAVLSLSDPVHTAKLPSSAECVEPDGSDLEVASLEVGQDQITERILNEEVSTTSVDVPQLWKRAVEIEADLRTEVAILGNSTYRPAARLHVAPALVMLGSLDFDRSDTVQVERLEKSGRWARVGFLDLQFSTSEFVAINSWYDAARGSLLQDGDRLRFQSRYENVSRERREEATRRILRSSAAVPRLIDVFNPSSAFLPTRNGIEVNEREIEQRYGLNPVQLSAFKNVLECRPVALLQGPPGTGKTQFIGALVHYALTSGLARNALVASQSHEAVNNAADSVLRLFGPDRGSLSMIRVGSEGSVSESLRPYHVARVERAYKDQFFATRRQRIDVAAEALGLDEDAVDFVMHFEDTVRPVLGRLSEAKREGDQPERVESLLNTLDQLLPERKPETDLRSIEADEVESYVARYYYSQCPEEYAAKIQRLVSVVDLGKDIVGSVSTWQRSFETFLAGTRQVVAGTCVGLGRGSLGLTKNTFDLVVVDEAARCTPSELAVPIQSGKWIVLVGDHAQLEPLHPRAVVEELSRELSVPLSEIQRSDFERVFESKYGKEAGATLTKQYRMLPPIGRVVSRAFYPTGLQHGRSKQVVDPAVLPNDLRTPLVWISTDGMGPTAYQAEDSRGRGSLINQAEADAILCLLRRWSEHEPFVEWLAQGTSASPAIGIICAYAAQRDYLWKRLQAENIPEHLRRNLKVDTIDSYQGKENLIVLVSLVRNNTVGALDGGVSTIAPGFMGRKNRVNVALSRAMDRLVIVGARTKWHSKSPVGVVATAFADEVQSGDAQIIDASDVIAGVQAKGGNRRRVRKTPSESAGDKS